MIPAAFFAHLKELFWADSKYWTLFGLVGNIMFTSRFVVQWYASEKLKQSIIPKNFWHLSLLGGLINLVYTIHVWKLPIILGSLLPPVIAARNLMLIARHQPPSGPPADEAPVPDDITPPPRVEAHETMSR